MYQNLENFPIYTKKQQFLQKHYLTGRSFFSMQRTKDVSLRICQNWLRWDQIHRRRFGSNRACTSKLNKSQHSKSERRSISDRSILLPPFLPPSLIVHLIVGDEVHPSQREWSMRKRDEGGKEQEATGWGGAFNDKTVARDIYVGAIWLSKAKQFLKWRS